MLTAQEAAKKWAARTSAASADYSAGVMRVSTSPGAAAAAAADRWQAKLAQASTREKFARRAGQVSLGDWQQAAATKGASRLSSGAQAAQPKAEQFFTKVLPYIAGGRAQIKSMPKLTVEDGVNRSATWIRYMAQFKS